MSDDKEPVRVHGHNLTMGLLESIMSDDFDANTSERLKAAELYLQYKGIPERELKAAKNIPTCFEVVYDERGDIKFIAPVEAKTIHMAAPSSDEHYWVQVIDGKPVQSFAKNEIAFVGK
jgi:hypothetical protein